jgi:transcription initiation factor IIE alpha subunit
MRKLSTREQTILDAMDEEIEELEKKLQKVQPLFDELNRLRKARGVMLDERSLTGKPRGGGKTNLGRGSQGAQMETIITYLREHGEASTTELAEYVGTTVGSIRAHLNRYRDERYRQNGGGNWSLIGEGKEDDDGEDD